MKNVRGVRQAFPVPQDTLHEAYADLGLRPSDLLQNDMVLLVEGATDVIFFEAVLEGFWRRQLPGVSIAVQQYGGDAAKGVISGRISIGNVTNLNPHVLWIRDRDAPPAGEAPRDTLRFKAAIESAGQKFFILGKREIEYYFPRAAIVAAQGADEGRKARAVACWSGDQQQKLSELASESDFQLPGGDVLRRALKEHLTEADLGDIAALLGSTLFPWRRAILGEDPSEVTGHPQAHDE
jgi:hypothetical protein